MKATIIIFSLFFLSTYSFGQTNNLQAKAKSIQVSGSAEMEVVPDELFFTVILREYLDKDKKKVKIENLEKELQSAVSTAGIPKENLQFENVYGERWKEKKGKPEEFLQSKTYIIKLSEPSKIDIVLDKIDSKGIENVYLSHYSHSQVEQYRKELKIIAIKNAKEKARYLLEAIGEIPGNALSVSENFPTPFYLDEYQVSNSVYGLGIRGQDQQASGISFKKIKLRFEIHAEFEIK